MTFHLNFEFDYHNSDFLSHNDFAAHNFDTFYLPKHEKKKSYVAEMGFHSIKNVL